MRSSSDWVRKPEGGWARAEVKQTRGLNKSHNQTLKTLFKGAATTVVTQLENEPLHQDYQRLISAGTKPNLAKLTIARKLAVIALSMWKSKERYNPTKHRKQGERLVSRVARSIPKEDTIAGKGPGDEQGSRVSIHGLAGPTGNGPRSQG